MKRASDYILVTGAQHTGPDTAGGQDTQAQLHLDININSRPDVRNLGEGFIINFSNFVP